jgi:hypothetical protein
MDKTDEAAGTVAALLHLTAIGVKNAITEINARLGWLFNQQNLIATHPKISVSEKTQLLWREFNPLAHAVEDNKIVAQTVHFREFKFHSLPHNLL